MLKYKQKLFLMNKWNYLRQVKASMIEEKEEHRREKMKVKFYMRSILTLQVYHKMAEIYQQEVKYFYWKTA